MLTSFVIQREVNMKIQPLELLNKMEWLKRIIEFFKKWLESCYTCVITPNNFGLKLLLLPVILPIGFLLGIKQRRYLMNCGLEESLILSALGYLTINITYSMMGKTQANLIQNLIQVDSWAIPIRIKLIRLIIKIHRLSKNLKMWLLMTLGMILMNLKVKI